MDADAFDLQFDVSNDEEVDQNTLSDTHDEGLAPPVSPELIPILDISFDENLSDILNDLEQNPSAEISESARPTVQTEVRVNNDPQFIDLKFNDVETFITNQENSNTIKKTLKDVNLVRKFLKMKNENRDLNEIPCDELDQLLAMFVLSVRKTDGQEYEPSSLRSIISSLDRKLGRQKYGHKIMDSQDDSFRLTRDALKAKQKNLKKQGKGNKPSKAEAISDEEINILYEKKILGNETPESLMYTLWFNNSIHFGLRGVTEHYNLRWGDIKLKVSSDGTEYLEYNERQTKTRTGDNIVDIRQVKPKMFSSGDIRDPVQSYKLYSAKRPLGFSSDEDPFYLSKRTIPLDDPRSNKWYLKQKVGEKKLASFMKEMAVKANFTGKKLTNHSARKHLIQKLRDENVPPTDIMQISGHKNVQSVLNYSSITENQQRKYSHILSSTSVDPRPNPTCTSNPQFIQNNATENFNLDLQVSEASSFSQMNSMFFGATLHIQNLNIYTGHQS
ncbi:uncharacterized protein KIAA1958 homolog [Saccostrea echinata]|uniref:uncharacterized protein KIAA1958 homolog n=1 Tax=Saccostrea echinata TaxID=191078 RepID=UPI002A80B1A9|nr:uncharacterized protein KIAA1958 homolog [Saccostrea echinata]